MANGEQNKNGHAYEYACIVAIKELIEAHDRTATIIEDTMFCNTRKAWNSLSQDDQELMRLSAQSMPETLFRLEPRMIEGKDKLTLSLQKDGKGEEGDVRDILIERGSLKWEVGLSVKHNHMAVKHSRLSKELDFGRVWLGHPCSQQYFDEIAPIFDELYRLKSENRSWSSIPDKEGSVYVPILEAFIGEMQRLANAYPDVPRKLVEYMLGRFDFYKVISLDNRRVTLIETFNFSKSLNKAGERKPTLEAPKVGMPEHLELIKMKEGSNTTLNIYLDNGWQFSLRIHSAATKVEPSLKFDIQLVGQPISIIMYSCTWKEV